MSPAQRAAFDGMEAECEAKSRARWMSIRSGSDQFRLPSRGTFMSQYLPLLNAFENFVRAEKHFISPASCLKRVILESQRFAKIKTTVTSL